MKKSEDIHTRIMKTILFEFDCLVSNPTMMNIIWTIISSSKITDYEDLFNVFKVCANECGIFNPIGGCILTKMRESQSEGYSTVMIFNRGREMVDRGKFTNFETFICWFLEKLNNSLCFTPVTIDHLTDRSVDQFRRQDEHLEVTSARGTYVNLRPGDVLINYSSSVNKCSDEVFVRNLLRLALVLKISINKEDTDVIRRAWVSSNNRLDNTDLSSLVYLVRRQPEELAKTRKMTNIQVFIRENLRHAFGKKIDGYKLHARYIAWGRTKTTQLLSYLKFVAALQRYYMYKNEYFIGIRFK